MSACVVHMSFYIVVFSIGTSGIGMFILSGAGPIIFGGAEGQLPKFWDYKPLVPHGLGPKFFVAFLLAHIGAALYRHLVLRDGLLWRMWYGSQGKVRGSIVSSRPEGEQLSHSTYGLKLRAKQT